MMLHLHNSSTIRFLALVLSFFFRVEVYLDETLSRSSLWLISSSVLLYHFDRFIIRNKNNGKVMMKNYNLRLFVYFFFSYLCFPEKMCSSKEAIIEMLLLCEGHKWYDQFCVMIWFNGDHSSWIVPFYIEFHTIHIHLLADLILLMMSFVCISSCFSSFFLSSFVN